MPTYDYRCTKCLEDFEVHQSFSDAPLRKHPGCGGKVTKVMSAAGIVLKGSGFYKTDSGDSARSKSKKLSESGSASASTSAESKSESKSESKTETKSETKSDSKSESKPKPAKGSEKKASSAA